MMMVMVVPPVMRKCERWRDNNAEQNAESGDKSESLHHGSVPPTGSDSGRHVPVKSS
jgi:hypothetical protein